MPARGKDDAESSHHPDSLSTAEVNLLLRRIAACEKRILDLSAALRLALGTMRDVHREAYVIQRAMAEMERVMDAADEPPKTTPEGRVTRAMDDDIPSFDCDEE